MAVSQDSDGWTVFTPSGDSRQIYVSDSEGSDSNNGSIGSPYKTIAKGQSELRRNFPDHLYLKRGDTFDENISSNISGGKIKGRSATEPMVFGAYGTGPRPKLRKRNSGGFSTGGASDTGYFAVVSLDFKPWGRNESTQPRSENNVNGIDVKGGSVGKWWVEDCRVYGFRENISIQGISTDIKGATIRRNIIEYAHGSYGTGTNKSQGIWFSKVSDGLIEENILDHNGWAPSLNANADATILNHNIYVSHGQAPPAGGDHSNGNLTIRGNISVRSSSLALKYIAKGTNTVENNLLSHCNGIGHIGGTQNSAPPATRTDVLNNVMEWSTNPIHESTGATGQGGLGLDGYRNHLAGTVEGNIHANNSDYSPLSKVWGFVCHYREVTGTSGGAETRNTLIRKNVFYNWDQRTFFGDSGVTGTTSGITVEENDFIDKSPSPTLLVEVHTTGYTFNNNNYFSTKGGENWFKVNGTERNFNWFKSNVDSNATKVDRSFTDPGRTFKRYALEVAGASTVEDYIETLKDQRKPGDGESGTWHTNAVTIVDWIRAGFDMAPIGDPPPPGNNPPVGTNPHIDLVGAGQLGEVGLPHAADFDYSDPDGDPAGTHWYNWQNDQGSGSWIPYNPTETNQQYTPVASDVGDKIRCIITPRDNQGLAGSNIVTNEIEIFDDPPPDPDDVVRPLRVFNAVGKLGIREI